MTRRCTALGSLLILAGACLPVASFAQTAYFSGDGLYKAFTQWRTGSPEQKERAAQAYGYMLGVAESRNFAARGEDGFRFCMPEIVTSTTLELTVTKWLERNPKRRNAGAPAAIAQALSESYPCRH